MKVGKLFIGLALAALVVIALVLVIGISNINLLVKTAVETLGPKILQTEVVLDQVDIEVTKGRGELKGFVIKNPQGFDSDYALSMGRVAVEIDPISLTAKVTVIKEIHVQGAKIIAEFTDLTHNNLAVLLDNIRQGREKPPGVDQTSVSDQKDGDTRLMVESFHFSQGDITVISPLWGKKTLTLPTIKLKNIGDKNNGLTPEALGQTLLTAVLSAAKKVVVKTFKSKLKQQAADKLKEKLKGKLLDKISDKNKGKLERLKELFKR